MSIYKGELTKPVIAQSIANLKKAFTALPQGFYVVFAERLLANGFTDERLQDAVNYVIDNCFYPTPTIAQFISFDKRIELYTYKQMLKMNDEYKGVFKHYKPVDVGSSKPLYARIQDIEKFKLKLFKRKSN